MKINPDNTLSNSEKALAYAIAYSDLSDKQRNEIVNRFYNILDIKKSHEKINKFLCEMIEHQNARQYLEGKTCL